MALVQYNYVAHDEKNPHELLLYIITWLSNPFPYRDTKISAL